jgi:hypothetical protein
LPASALILKTHAEGVIKAFAEGRHEIRWVISELTNDLQRGLPKQTLVVLIRELTYGRKFWQWREQNRLIVTRLKQLEKSLNLG